ncbi:MAG: MFS transporter, partial [Myxococcota bacterium]
MHTDTPQTTQTPPGNAGAQGNRPLLRMFVVLLIELIGFGIAIPVLPFLAKDFGASGLMVGLLFAAQAAGQFVMAPLWGALSDRLGRKPVLIATLLGAAGASYLTALSGSLGWLFAARILAGMAAGNVSTASAYITDVTDEDNRSKGMAVIGISFGLGFMLGPAIGAFLAQMGHALVFEVTAAISAVNAVVALVVLHEPRRRRSRAEVRGTLRTMGALLQRPQTARVLSMTLVYAVSITLLESMFAVYALETFGYGPKQVGFILAGLAVVMVLVQGGGVARVSKALGDRTMT